MILSDGTIPTKDNTLRAAKSKRRAAALRKAQAEELIAPLSGQAAIAVPTVGFDWRKDSTPMFELSTVPSLAEKREMYGQSVSPSADPSSLPCTCEKSNGGGGALTGYILASLGIGGGVDPAISGGLIPLPMADANRRLMASPFEELGSPESQESGPLRRYPSFQKGKRRSTLGSIGINLKASCKVASGK
jgi:hypothetical protein